MRRLRIIAAHAAWTIGGCAHAAGRGVVRGPAAFGRLLLSVPRSLASLVLRIVTAGATWALVIYGAGAFLITSPVWRDAANSWAGACCDPQQTMWFLRWAPYALSHHIDPFFTYQLNAPFGVNLMWNAAIVGPSMIVSPVTLLFGPVVAYNVAVAAGIALGGFCMYFVLRRYTSGLAGPIVGGALYAFCPYEVSQSVIHLNLGLIFFPPLFLLVLDTLVFRHPRRPWLLGIVLGVLAAVQLVTSEEVLFTSVIFAVIFLLIVSWYRWPEVRARAADVVEALVAATLTFVVLTLFPLAVQFYGSQQVHGAVADSDVFSTDLLNIIVPTQWQRLSPPAATAISRHFTGLDFEATAYVGLPLLIFLAVFAGAKWRDRRVRTAALVAVIAFVLSLGAHLHIGGQSTGWPLPWWPLAHLPLVENILPARLTLYMWMGISVLVAMAIDMALLSRLWERATAQLTLLAASLVLIVPAVMPLWRTDTPAFFKNWSQQGIPESATVLIAPFFRDGGGAAPMLWTAEAGAGVSMPEAYAYVPSAQGTPQYGPLPTNLSNVMESIQDTGNVVVARGDIRDAIEREMMQLQIQDIIVGPMDKHDEMVTFFTDLMGRSPQDVQGVQLWANVQQQGVSPAPP